MSISHLPEQPDQPGQPNQAMRPDDLKQRYLQASSEQAIGPSEQVRQAVLAHAHKLAHGAARAAPASATVRTTSPPAVREAANSWKFSLAASVAIASISTLLVLQFDRTDSLPAAKVQGSQAVVTTPPAVREQQTAPELAADMSAKSSATAITPVPEPEPAIAPATPTAPIAKKEMPAAAQARPAPVSPPPPPPAADALAKNQTRPEAATERAAMPSITPPAPTAAPTAAAPTTAAPTTTAAPAALGTQSPSAAPADAEFATAMPERQKARPSIASPTEQPSVVQQSRSAAATAPTPTPAPAPTRATALHNAARIGSVPGLEQTLQQSSTAQINALDEKGQTPLLLAVQGGHISAVQRLLAAGADPAVKNRQGLNAVQMAQQLGFAEIENLLKKPP